MLAVVALSLATSACSDDAAPSASEYRSRVGRICRDLRRRTGALPHPAANSTSDLVRVGRRALALQRGALGRIQALDAPTEDERTVGRWLEDVDRALDAGAASLDAQQAGDLVAARTANQRGGEATARADELARTLRVPDCATPVTG
jgi:hypothetical protein